MGTNRMTRRRPLRRQRPSESVPTIPLENRCAGIPRTEGSNPSSSAVKDMKHGPCDPNRVRGRVCSGRGGDHLAPKPE